MLYLEQAARPPLVPTTASVVDASDHLSATAVRTVENLQNKLSELYSLFFVRLLRIDYTYSTCTVRTYVPVRFFYKYSGQQYLVLQYSTVVSTAVSIRSTREGVCRGHLESLATESATFIGEVVL